MTDGWTNERTGRTGKAATICPPLGEHNKNDDILIINKIPCPQIGTNNHQQQQPILFCEKERTPKQTYNATGDRLYGHYVHECLH